MEEFSRQGTNIAGLESILHKYNTMFPANALRVYFTSNHDENSHSGSEYERMGKFAKAFAVLCAAWNGIPLVYSGQELPNKKRLKFFDKDSIKWTGNYELHVFYKILLELHSSNPALRAGDIDVKTHRIQTSNDDNIFAFLRSYGKYEVLIFLNLSFHEDLYFAIQDEKVNGEFRNVFSQTVNNLSIHSAIKMHAYGYLVFQKVISNS
jgi:glycosidase